MSAMSPRGQGFTSGARRAGRWSARLVGACLLWLAAEPAEAGSWTSTGALNAGRSYHTATALADGRVLAAGGSASACSPGCELPSAELYDPDTGQWTFTGALGTARALHTATLLDDGKVLVAGGSSCCADASPICTYLTSAELYDPATGQWSPTGSMSTGRERHTATLLPGGKVLIAGGTNYLTPALASAELYDHETGTWSNAAPMQTARHDFTATALPDGAVLVAGGCCPANAGAETYDAARDAWTPTRTLRLARSSHAATLLQRDLVLISGGDLQYCTIEGCGTQPLPIGQVYRPRLGLWTFTARMLGPRDAHTATLLPTGEVLAAGGSSTADPKTPLATSELFDPRTGTWRGAGRMAHGRVGHTATPLLTGEVLVAGGLGDCLSFCRQLSAAEIYSP